MPAKNSAASAVATSSDREIVLTRVFDAPREVVWKAWTDLQHIVKSWGPNGFKSDGVFGNHRVGDRSIRC